MNILVLMAGQQKIEDNEANYPLALHEFRGVPLIEYQIRKFEGIKNCKKLFAIKVGEDKKFHLSRSIRLIDPKAKIELIKGETKGSACTALMLAKEINNEEPLLIVSVDEVIDESYGKIIEYFQSNDFDAGAVIFDAVHPRYSFVRLNERSEVIEAAEKRPISKNASAGFYYFSKGQFFIDGAMSMIKKSATVDDRYFIAPVFNELILNHKRVGTFKVSKQRYFPLKNESQVREFTIYLEGLKNEKI